MCNNFETIGLLYVSGELTAAEAADYEAHLAVCAECAGEVGDYKNLRAYLYTPDNLSEDVPPEIDAKIMSACAGSKSKKTRPPVAFLVPMMFIKKYAPIPIFLMLVMVAVGGYVRYHSMTAENLRAEREHIEQLDGEQKTVVADADTNVISDDPIEVDGDSDLDSERLQQRHLGDMSLPGVVPVSGE